MSATAASQVMAASEKIDAEWGTGPEFAVWWRRGERKVTGLRLHRLGHL